MMSSTFIYEENPEKLQHLGEGGVDALDNFTVIDMDTMMALDFTMLCGRAVKWHQGEPAVLSDGLVVVQVSPTALEFVIGSQHDALDTEQRADIERLSAFVMAHGAHHVWEYATF